MVLNVSEGYHSFPIHFSWPKFVSSTVLGSLLWMQYSLWSLDPSYANAACVHYQTVFSQPFIYFKKIKIKVTCIFCMLFQTPICIQQPLYRHVSFLSVSTKINLRFLPPTNSLNKTLRILSQKDHGDGSFFQSGIGWPIFTRSNTEPKSRLYRHLTDSVMKISCLLHDFTNWWLSAYAFLVEWDQQYLAIHLQFRRWISLLLHSKEELQLSYWARKASNRYGNCD